MTDNSGHSKNKHDRDKVFEHFSGREKDDVDHIWKMSSRFENNKPAVTEDDVENALQKVHGRMNQKNITDHQYGWRWVAAAAVILLVFGAGILLMPITTTAPHGEITTMQLPDGSTVELNSGSSLAYNRLFTYTNRSVRLEGEAFFSVDEGEHPFTVSAGNSTVAVTGTEFNVRSWSEDPEGETEVAVSEGTVTFYPQSRSDSAVTINPGYISRLNSTMDKPTPPERVSVERVMGWRDKMLIFSDKSLLVIFRELERRFDIEIRLESDAIANETLTTYYKEKTEDPESIIEDICRVKGLRYSETANGYRVYK